MSASPFIDPVSEHEVHTALLDFLKNRTITSLQEDWHITRGSISRMKNKRDAISARVAKKLGFEKMTVYRRIL